MILHRFSPVQSIPCRSRGPERNPRPGGESRRRCGSRSLPPRFDLDGGPFQVVGKFSRGGVTSAPVAIREVCWSPPPERRERVFWRVQRWRWRGSSRFQVSQGREIEEFPVPFPFQEDVQVMAKPGLRLLAVAHLMLHEGSNEDEPPGPPPPLMSIQPGLSAPDLSGQHLFFLPLEGLDSLFQSLFFEWFPDYGAMISSRSEEGGKESRTAPGLRMVKRRRAHYRHFL